MLVRQAFRLALIDNLLKKLGGRGPAGITWDRTCRIGIAIANFGPAQLFSWSNDPADWTLGAKLEAFVRGMPQPDTQRLALARELRSANEAMRRRELGGYVNKNGARGSLGGEAGWRCEDCKAPEKSLPYKTPDAMRHLAGAFDDGCGANSGATWR